MNRVRSNQQPDEEVRIVSSSLLLLNSMFDKALNNELLMDLVDKFERNYNC